MNKKNIYIAQVKNKAIYLFSLIFLTGILSCSDDKDEFLEGTWEVVNVADIEATHTQIWEFNSSVLTISREQKGGGNRLELDTGFYRLKNSLYTTQIRIDNTSNDLYNDDWDVIELSRERMIISMRVTGGIIYREFIKKP